MTNLEITQRQIKDVTIMDLAGDIRLSGGNIVFRKTLRVMVENDIKNVLVNLANVNYVDSSGLGELVAGYVSLEKVNGKLKLINLSERIRNLMVMTKLVTIFEIFDNEEEAIASFETASTNDEVKQSAIVTEQLDVISGNTSIN